MSVPVDSPEIIQLDYEGTIVSDNSPRLIYEQTRAMIGNFGLLSTLQSLIYKRTGESDDIEFEIHAKELAHPLSIRKTHSDLASVIDVFCRRIYDLPNELVRKIGSKAIVDLGAYNGTTPAYFANHYPASRILAIEPNPRNYPLLTQNGTPYGDQIETVFAAVSPISGSARKVEFGFQTDSMQNAFLPSDNSEPTVEPDEDTDIGSITPEDILAKLDSEGIGVLKVDVEGAEKPLFASPAINELLRRTGILLIETHDQFMPGANEAVYNAAVRNGLRPSSYNNHTELYYR